MLIKLIWGIGLAPISIFGLILFTLAYLWKSPNTQESPPLKYLMIIAFGLIHGFGFASVLIDLGLPKDKTVTALLGFNLGVEFGQILVVLLAIVILYMLGKSSLIKYKDYLFNFTAIILIALGTFWFIGRAFSLQ